MNSRTFMLWIRIISKFIYPFLFMIVISTRTRIILFLPIFCHHVDSWSKFYVLLFYLIYKCFNIIQTRFSPPVFQALCFVIDFFIILMTTTKCISNIFFNIIIKLWFELIWSRFRWIIKLFMNYWFITDSKASRILIVLSSEGWFWFIVWLAISVHKK